MIKMYTTYKPQNSFARQEQYPPVMQYTQHMQGAPYQPHMQYPQGIQYTQGIQYPQDMQVIQGMQGMQDMQYLQGMHNQPKFSVQNSQWRHLLDRSPIDGNSPDYVQIYEKPFAVEGRGDRSETVGSATETISAAPKQDTKIKIILEHHLREIKEALSDIKRMLATHQKQRNELSGVVDVAQ